MITPTLNDRCKVKVITAREIAIEGTRSNSLVLGHGA